MELLELVVEAKAQRAPVVELAEGVPRSALEGVPVEE